MENGGWQRVGGEAEVSASSRASAAEQQQEIGRATGATRYAEMASKLFDFKALGKPPMLEGHKAGRSQGC